MEWYKEIVMNKPKIGAIVYSVSSLQRTVAFYRDVIGLEVNTRTEREGDKEETFAMAQAGDVTLVFFEKPEKVGRTPTVVFELGDGGIDTFTEKLAKQGVTIVMPVSHAPGGWSSDFLDPDGHVLAYYQTASKPRVI
jgi:glyoxylase I family protein